MVVPIKQIINQLIKQIINHGGPARENQRAKRARKRGRVERLEPASLRGGPLRFSVLSS